MRAAMYDTYRLPQGKVVADLDGADGNILIQLHRGTPRRLSGTSLRDRVLGVVLEPLSWNVTRLGQPLTEWECPRSSQSCLTSPSPGGDGPLG
ncbi:hypothetical protein OG762_45460 [Streptomyces sp. NBC_01136]|uniref:hypothetical protein n=1 Tax=unclassified Streptomyces TaxID=2593676 RepID=UPI0032431F69|nr:hypothetical protein OG762_45460 [Streptomyces sp. NBC_01136]